MENTDNTNFIYRFNNRNSSAGFFIIYILSGVLFLGLLCYLIFKNLNLYLVITIGVAIVYFVLFHLYKPSFIELLVTESELQVNYYSVATAIKSYQTIVIDRSQFKGFEIKKKHRGIQRQLILTVESKFGLADYPPISISILNKKELDQIKLVLSKISDNNP